MRAFLPVCLLLLFATGASAQNKTAGNIGIWSNNPPNSMIDSGNAIAPGNFQINGNLAVNGKAFGNFPAGVSVEKFGADPTGVADSTTAFNQCLSNVGVGGTCSAAHGKFKLLGNVLVPGNRTLNCGDVYLDVNEDSKIYPPTILSDLPALMLDAGHSIIGMGAGATIVNCFIYRNGMTFPSVDSTQFTGIAVQAHYANEAASFAMINTIIVGFDTCLWVTARRPYLFHGMCDARGVNKAAMELDTGNTDYGTMIDYRVQQVAQYGLTCTAVTRAGTGIRIGPNPHVPNDEGPGMFLDRVTAQGFSTTDFDILIGAYAGTIWADGLYRNPADPTWDTCPIGDDMIIRDRGHLVGNMVLLNLGKTGLRIIGGGRTTKISHLVVCCTEQEAIILGDANDAPDKAGNLKVGMLEIGGFGTRGHSTGIAFTTANDTFEAFSVSILYGRNGSEYIASSNNEILGRLAHRYMAFVSSDVANPYSGVRMGAGADDMLMMPDLRPSVACLGLGDGDCGFGNPSYSSLSGIILVNAGTGANNTASAILTFPVVSVQGYMCNANLTGIPNTVSITVGVTSITASTFYLATNDGSPLTGTTALYYNCRPI